MKVSIVIDEGDLDVRVDVEVSPFENENPRALIDVAANAAQMATEAWYAEQRRVPLQRFGEGSVT